MSAVARLLIRVVLLVCLAALLLPSGLQRAEARPTVQITASGATTGMNASGLLHPSRSRAAVWRSDRTLGATLTTRFAVRTRVDGTRIRAAAASQRLTEVRLEFSDGSTLLVHLDARGDRAVAFPSRVVRWVRLTVIGAPAGQKAVALSGWTVQKGGGKRVSTSATFVARPSVAVSSGKAVKTRWTASSRASGQWIRLAWRKPVEVSAIRVTGGAKSAERSVKSGTLVFSDGSRVIVGALEPHGGTSTTIAFAPRVVTSVRFVVGTVGGGGTASTAAIRAYPVNVVPGPPATTAKAYKRSWTAARCGGSVRAAAPTSGLRLLCPTNGSTTGSTLRVVLSAPAGAAVAVRAWMPKGAGGSIRVVTHGAADASGTVRLAVPTAQLLHGPAAVRISAAGVTDPLYVQFVNESGVTQRITPSKLTRGLDLKFDETFSDPLSATRTGAKAVYASGKPNQYWVDDFGQAIFAQPDGTASTASTMAGGYLRIPVRPLPKGVTDGAGYGRTATGGLLSSAHMGASGFVAQYGYFEVRMLAPAGPGTWPAFWMLSSGGLLGGRAAAEVDAAELYGATPSTVYQTTHSWVDGKDGSGRQFVPTLPAGGDTALSWHTYGARILPTGVDFYIDGRFVARAGPVVHADQPFFFLIDLALTPGWEDGLSSTGHRVALYVDSIRVWV